jgi:hypothetical protein
MHPRTLLISPNRDSAAPFVVACGIAGKPTVCDGAHDDTSVGLEARNSRKSPDAPER